MSTVIDYSTYKKPTDFLKYESESTRVRILSQGIMMNKHSGMAGGKYVSMGECPGEGCELCKAGKLPKLVYMWIVYSYETREVKLLEAGTGLGSQLSFLGQEQGDPIGYDVVIKKNGAGKQVRYEASKATTPAPELMNDEKRAIIAAHKRVLANKYGFPTA